MPYMPQGLLRSAVQGQQGQVGVQPNEQPPQSNMFAELLAQISGANPNWAYDDAQVSQLDDAFRQQFEQQQSPYAPPPMPPERPLDVPTPAPQIPPPQMPTSRLQDQEMTAAIMSQRGEMPAWMADMQRAEARQQAPQQMPATAATAIGGSQVPGIPTATGGLDPARLGEVAEARRLQAEQAQGIPRIPTATPGMNRPAFDVPVQQMPRSQRMGKPMSPMFEGPQRHPGMMTQRQPLQQRPIQQQAPRSGSGTWAGHVNAGSRNIGSSRMPNTGRMTSSFGGQRQPNQPGMPSQPGMFGGPGQPQQRGGFLPAAPGGGSQFGRPGGGGGSPHWTNRAQGVGAAAQRPVDTGGPTTLGNFLERERRLSQGG